MDCSTTFLYFLCKIPKNTYIEYNYTIKPHLVNMVDGYCLKCKTYGQIKDGVEITMTNGRTRIAGFCSMIGCDGKISKIIS